MDESEFVADQDGFTLLEVAVALVILGLGLAGFYQSFGTGMLGVRTSEREEAAGEAADQIFLELGRSRPIVDGVFDGALPDGEKWRLVIRPLDDASPTNPPSPVIGHLATLDILGTDHRPSPRYRFNTVLLTHE